MRTIKRTTLFFLLLSGGIASQVFGQDTLVQINQDSKIEQLVAIKKELENLAGEDVALTSADGCGAPLFLISLFGLARAMRAITISTDPIHQSVVQACRDFPEMVAGEKRLTTRLMREVPGLFMKEGAEGVEVATLANGRTIVFKISDGSIRPFETLMVAALAEFGINIEDKTERIYGGSEAIGSMRACITRG